MGTAITIIHFFRYGRVNFRLLFLFFCFGFSLSNAQTNKLTLVFPGNADFFAEEKISFKAKPGNINEAEKNIKSVLSQLRSKGYISCNRDSSVFRNDTLMVYVYTGKKYVWSTLKRGNAEEEALIYAGYREKIFRGRFFSPKEINELFERLIHFYEDRGYPFTGVKLDSLNEQKGTISGVLRVEKNKLYKIDSVLVKGDAKISMPYLYNFISIEPGDIYKESLVQQIDLRIKEISFVELAKPSEIIFTDNQCLVIIYLKKKKASQFNGILGVVPDNKTNKIVITGDAAIRIRNGFGKGELIDFNWRKLNNQIQDLKINFNYPFLFKSPFGTDLQFKLYKKDSTFIELQQTAALQYYLKGGNYFKVFLGNHLSSLITPKMFENATTLPPYADVSTFTYGIGFKKEKLDYRLNPRSGFSVSIEGSAGQRKISINPILNPVVYENVNLKSNQLKGQLLAEFFIPLLKRTTLKIGNNSAFVQNNTLFTNELYRIGGIRTLRGFSEESIFASTYSISTLEYRFLLDRNSAVYIFYDQAIYEKNDKEGYLRDQPYGFGTGLFFQTKAGVFSLSYALGSQLGNPILIRSAKVHFGFINYF